MARFSIFLPSSCQFGWIGAFGRRTGGWQLKKRCSGSRQSTRKEQCRWPYQVGWTRSRVVVLLTPSCVFCPTPPAISALDSVEGGKIASRSGVRLIVGPTKISQEYYSIRPEWDFTLLWMGWSRRRTAAVIQTRTTDQSSLITNQNKSKTDNYDNLYSG